MNLRARCILSLLIGMATVFVSGLGYCQSEGEPLYFFSEVHIDDYALQRNFTREVFDSVNAVVLRLAQIAEKHGHRLSFHSREYFARGCVEFQGVEKNTLRELEARGHEVGTHCHGSRFAEARDAVNSCGVKNNLCIEPGMIRDDPQQASKAYSDILALGYKFSMGPLSSDPDKAKLEAMRSQLSVTPGLNPWRPDKIVAVDLSVVPWDWKMMVLPGQEWSHPVDREVNQAEYLVADNFQLLRGLVDRQLTRIKPGKINYFGYAFHEHQFTTDDHTLPKPVEESFAAFDEFLGGLDKLVADKKLKYATSLDVYNAYVEWEKQRNSEEPVTKNKAIGSATKITNSARSPVYFEINVAPLDDRNKELSKQAVLRYISIFKKHGVTATFSFFPAVAQNVVNEQPEVLDALRDAGLPAHGSIMRGEGSQMTIIDVPLESMKTMEGLQPGEDLSRHIPGATGKVQMPSSPLGSLPQPPTKRGLDLFTSMPNENAEFFWCMGRLVMPPRRMGINPGGIYAQYGARKEMIEAGILPKVVHPVEKLKYLLEQIPDDRFNYLTLHGHEGESYYVERRGDEKEPPKLALSEEYFRVYEEIIACLASHPRVKIVTGDELQSLAMEQVVPLGTGRSVSADKICQAARFIVNTAYWRQQPPDYVPLDGDYWSLADTFQALCGSLALYAENNKLPESVTIREIYGPLEDTRPKPGERYSMNEEGWMYKDDYPAREELLRTGQTSYPGQVGVDTRKIIFDQFWAGHNADYDVLVPGREILDTTQRVRKEMTNAVPAFVPVKTAGRSLNPYEFLFIMAEELLKIHDSGAPQPVLVAKLFEIPKGGGNIGLTHGFYTAKAREMPEDEWLSLLQLWTFKPAVRR